MTKAGLASVRLLKLISHSIRVLHLRLEIRRQLLQLLLVRTLHRPIHGQPLLLVWLWDEVEVYVVDLLMCYPAIVL